MHPLPASRYKVHNIFAIRIVNPFFSYDLADISSSAVSIGIAASENHDLKTPEDYINAADKNMYHQKQKSSK